jgi:thiamine kinase-like enzyme
MIFASNETAVQRVRELASSFGLECEPVALADASNLVLRLAPHPIVARVAMATSMVRAGVAWLEREVVISRFLAERGGGVTRPSQAIDPGPNEHGGLVVSFWELETELSRAPDPRRAGLELARLHRELRGLTAAVPEWGAWSEMRAVHERMHSTDSLISPAERRRVDAAWQRAEAIVSSARARSTSFQIVHGDAHIRNVMATERGELWTDWEDAFLGPVEWDLACMRSRLDLFGEEREAIEALCSAYDEPLNADLVRELGLVRNVQVILWVAVFAERDPTRLARLRQRIERLPEP